MFKYGNLFIFFTLFCLFIIGQSWAYTPRPGSPLALHQHPRLHITQSTIPHFREVLSRDFVHEYQDYVNWAFSSDDNDSHNILSEAGHDPLRALMVHQAFIAAIGQVEGISYPGSLDDLAQRAINSLIRRLNAGDELSYVAVLTYDWAYNFMNNDQRANIVNMMRTRPLTHKTYSQTLANPDITPENIFSSKYYEGMFAWYLGLAIWGDGLADADADRSVDTFFDDMLNYGYLDGQNFVAGNDGGWPEWIGYASWHPRTHFLNMDAWFTATGQNYIAEYGEIPGQAMVQFPKLIVYALDPHKYFNRHYTYIRQGGAETTDCSFEHRSMREQMYSLPYMLEQAGFPEQAGLLRHIIDNYDVQWPQYEHFYLWPFLGIYRSVTEKTAEELSWPKSNWSKNMGSFFARTGFDSPADGVFVAFDGHFNLEGHDGAENIPGFALAKFGELVNTRNVAHRGYGNLENYPGAHRFNIVYFAGGHEVTQREMGDPNQLREAFNGQGDWDLGGLDQVTRRNDRFYYVRINRSRKYSSDVTHTRAMVWIPGANPQNDSDFLVVYDRTHAPSQPEWVYHIPWEPYVSNFNNSENITTGTSTSDRIGFAYTGNQVVVKELNSRGGEQDSEGGDQDYVGGGGAHGVAFCRTILPEQARVEVTRVAQFDDNVIKRQHHLAIKSHRWQVSIKPTQAETTHRFLNVFQTGEEKKLLTVSNMQLVEVGAAMQGVFVEAERAGRPNKIVLFSKEDAVNENTITYSVSKSGLTQHIISGIKPYTIYDIQQISDSGTTSFQQGTESDIQLWDYKGVAVNVPRGVLFFETTVSGNTTFVITPDGEQDVTPPTKPQGLRLK